jgi:DtxR family transcriptional regulator, Mn-dependent transcriptional regulator
MYSFTEENYIKAIYKLQEKSAVAISTNAIAEVMQTKAASVTDMIKKLSEKDLLSYERYKGVELTELGSKMAIELIRKHRLWETFLHDKLNFTWDEVHDIAEQLEHIHSTKLIDSLDEFLGFPKNDPHGDPIPSKNGLIHKLELFKISEMGIGEKGIISGVVSHTSLFLQHLEKNGLVLGTKIELLAKSDFDHSMKIRIENSNPIMISNEVARNILLNKLID